MEISWERGWGAYLLSHTQVQNRDLEALSILPWVWVSLHWTLPTLEVKVRVQGLGHSLIPDYVVHTSKVPWEVFGAMHTCSVKEPM